MTPVSERDYWKREEEPTPPQPRPPWRAALFALCCGLLLLYGLLGWVGLAVVLLVLWFVRRLD